MNDNDRSIVGFTMLGHALFHAYELSIPVFVVAWLDAFGTTEATLGVVVGAGYALVGVGALPAGILSDRRPSKRLVVLAIFGMGLGFLLLSAAPTVVWVGGALLVWGLAASLYHPAALALLSRGTDRRGTALAYHGVAGNVGTVLGPLLAALALAVAEWRVVAGLFVLPAVVGGVVALRLEFDERAGVENVEGVETPDPAETDGGTAGASLADFRRASRRLFTPTFALVFLVVMLYGLFYRGVLTFLPEVLADLPLFGTARLGSVAFDPSRYVYAGLLLVGVAGQYVGGRLSDRVHTIRLLGGVFVALALASLLFVPAATGVGSLLAVCVALGFLVYVTAPVYQAAVADHSGTTVQGLSYGFTYLGMFGVGALGSALAGVVLSTAGSDALFVVLAAVAAAAAGLCGWLLRRE
jgi:MFS family permease